MFTPVVLNPHEKKASRRLDAKGTPFGQWAAIFFGFFLVSAGASTWFAWSAREAHGRTAWLVLALMMLALVIMARRGASRGDASIAALVAILAGTLALYAFETAPAPQLTADRLARPDLPSVGLATAGLVIVVAAVSLVGLALRRGPWIAQGGTALGTVRDQLMTIARGVTIGGLGAFALVAAADLVATHWQDRIADQRIAEVITYTERHSGPTDRTGVSGPLRPGLVAWIREGAPEDASPVHRGDLLIGWEGYRDEEGHLTATAIVAQDVHTGDERWRFKVDGTALDDVVVGRDYLVAVVDNRLLVCLDLTNGKEVATARLPETSEQWDVVRDEPSIRQPRIVDTDGTNVVFLRSALASLDSGETDRILAFDMPALRLWWQQDVPASLCQFAVAADSIALLRWGTGCGDPVITAFRDKLPHAHVAVRPPPGFGPASCDRPDCVIPFKFAADRDVALVLLWGPSGRRYHAELVEITVHDGTSWRLPLAEGGFEEIDSAVALLVGLNKELWIVSDGNDLKVVRSWPGSGALDEVSLLPREQPATLVSDGQRVYTLRHDSAVVVRRLDQNGQLTYAGTMALPRPCDPRSTAPLTLGAAAVVAHCDDGTSIVLVEGPAFRAPPPDIAPW